MAIIPYETSEQATTRSRELWEAILGRAKQPQDVTEFLYGVHERPTDPDPDYVEILPDGVDVAIVVAERDAYLDRVIVADAVEPREAGAVAALYPAWGVGATYAVNSLVSYDGALYRCRQAHTSQSDWQPDVVLALWTVYRENADTELAWVGSEPVSVGTLRTYNGRNYECLQAHVTQADWLPPNVPALWEDVTPVPVTDEWTAGVAYTVGDIVMYNGRLYQCRQSHTSIASWTPLVLSLWLPL